MNMNEREMWKAISDGFEEAVHEAHKILEDFVREISREKIPCDLCAYNPPSSQTEADYD